MPDLCAYDAVALAGLLRRREVSAREVIAAHIARIEALDGAVNAVVTRCFDAALAKAAEADAAVVDVASPSHWHLGLNYIHGPGPGKAFLVEGMLLI